MTQKSYRISHGHITGASQIFPDVKLVLSYPEMGGKVVVVENGTMVLMLPRENFQVSVKLEERDDRKWIGINFLIIFSSFWGVGEGNLTIKETKKK